MNQQKITVLVVESDKDVADAFCAMLCRAGEVCCAARRCRSSRDPKNNHVTFMTILGPEGAHKEMWDHYCQAIEAQADIP